MRASTCRWWSRRTTGKPRKRSSPAVLDVAVTETLHLAQDAARGKPVIGFSRFLHTDGGVMYLKNRGIERR